MRPTLLEKINYAIYISQVSDEPMQLTVSEAQELGAVVNKLLEACTALIGALGLKRPNAELIEDYGMLGLDAIQRAKAAIAAAEGRDETPQAQ